MHAKVRIKSGGRWCLAALTILAAANRCGNDRVKAAEDAAADVDAGGSDRDGNGDSGFTDTAESDAGSTDAGPEDGGVPVCDDECNHYGTSCEEGVSYGECSDFDGDFCLEWRDLPSCGDNASCVARACKCAGEFGNCNDDWSDGCESDPDTDALNCGGCSRACYGSNVQTVLCTNGTCDYDSCIAPFIDADGDRANGCEAGSYFPRVIGRDNIDGEHLLSIVRTPDAGYLGVGVAEIKNPGRIWPMWVIKLNAAGETEWEKWYCDTSICVGRYIQANGPSGYVIAGQMAEGKYTDTDLLLVFIDTAGTVTNTRRYGGRYRTAVAAAAKTANDGIVIVGNTQLTEDSDNALLFAKISASGDLVWKNAIGGFTGAALSAFGDGYVAIGVADDAPARSLVVFKFTADGELEWGRRISGESTFGASLGSSAVGDHLILAGSASGPDYEDTSAFVIKMGTDGKIDWSRAFSGTTPSFARALAPMDDGGVLVAGHVHKGAGFADVLLFNVNPAGDLGWRKALGGPRDDGVDAIFNEPDGNFLISAGTTSFGNPGANEWLLRVDPSGGIRGNCLVDLNRTVELSAAEFAITVDDADLVPSEPEFVEKPFVLSEHDGSADNFGQCLPP